ncbi:MAG TPA: hypothetical protein VG778_07455, partial [Blastocatellia bacterium]|nr:hypothetical protein [Blastocatellia bacterium]
LWRVMLWARFLLLVSRLRLRLVPGHPDRAAGLFFLSASLRGFRLLAFAIGSVAAGTVANRVAREGGSPLEFKPVAIVIGVVVIVLFAGPLVLFVSKLREARARGTFMYGALACSVGRQFEQKWLDRTDEIDQEALGQPDFSATTDLYGIVSNVYEMRDVPFSLIKLVLLVASALLPFLPVALLVVPLKVVLQEVAKFLL